MYGWDHPLPTFIYPGLIVAQLAFFGFLLVSLWFP